VSIPLVARLFVVALVVAAEDVEEELCVLTAFTGPRLPPWTGREMVGGFWTLAAAAENWAIV